MAESWKNVLPWILLISNIVVPILSTAVWDQKDIEIKQGADLVAKCKVEDLGDFGVARITRTVPSTQEEDVIADMATLKTKYAETGRYNVTAKWDGNNVELTLRYKTLRGEDTGEISCFKMGQRNAGSKFLLRVLVPLQDVYFMVESGDSGEFRPLTGDTVFLRQGTKSRITCVFKREGTTFPPTMHIDVGGQSEFGHFLRKDIPVNEKLPEGGWREAMTVKLTYDTMTPPADFNDKNLTCKGTVDGYPPMESTVKLDIQFAPIITCPKYEWYGQLRRSMTIACSVSANPGSTISWFYGPDRESAELIEDDNQAFMKNNKAFGAAETHVSLKIRRLNATAHLTNFYLSASNDIDTKEVTVTVNEGARDTDPDIHLENQPNRPSYSTNQNKPSKRQRAREPEMVRSSSTRLSSTSSVLLFISAVSAYILTSVSRR